LAENIRQVFWIVASDFRKVLYVSPAYEDIWQRTCKSLYANPASWMESVVEEDRGWLMEAIERKLAGKEPGGRMPPYRIRWPDGTIRWIQARSVPIKDESGRITRIAGVAEDITSRKHAEEERERLLEMLEAKNKELQSVVYIASHDLKSPLVNICGFSRQLTESCDELRRALEETSMSEEARDRISGPLEEDIPQAVDFIRSGADKMKMVVEGLLKVSRVGTAQLTISELDMDRIVNGILEAMNYEIRECGADVVVEKLPRCAGDRDQIDRAFSNLLHNAVKYLYPARKGQIRVRGWREAQMSVYCVEDNGVGIPPEHQTRVFEIFHRVDPTCGVAGEGLGLSIVSRILDRHKGRVWLESEPGQGSKFFVALPSV
jgi:PAS domain S-box-containing protein